MNSLLYGKSAVLLTTTTDKVGKARLDRYGVIISSTQSCFSLLCLPDTAAFWGEVLHRTNTCAGLQTFRLSQFLPAMCPLPPALAGGRAAWAPGNSPWPQCWGARWGAPHCAAMYAAAQQLCYYQASLWHHSKSSALNPYEGAADGGKVWKHSGFKETL